MADGEYGKGNASVTPAASMNICVTDGRHIVCTRYRNHPVEESPSLYYMSGAGFVFDEESGSMRVTAHGEAVFKQTL